MNTSELDKNLKLLLERLAQYETQNSISVPNPPPREAVNLSQSLFLAHSTPDGRFPDICISNRLLSPAQLARIRNRDLKADSIHAVLGTGNYVFLYAGPFRFPATGCGLLFGASLETEHHDGGLATPFDSGGLVSVFSWPDQSESAKRFLARHELPIPGHRDYLHNSMTTLFGHPWDYLSGRNPRWPGPIGLTGGDQRRWTHEVRIPDQVIVRAAHLQAAFARTALAATNPEVEKLYRWCDLEGVDFITFDTPRGNNFEVLQRACLDYIRQKLL